MYGLADIDDIILSRLNTLGIQSKFFIEAGANDGITQSNTALLEFHHGWKGLLIEPNLENFQKAQSLRKMSTVFRGALVSSDYPHEKIEGIFSSESVSRWNGLCSGVTKFHIEEFPQWKCEVPTITLTKALNDCRAPRDIGLLSLDVEGYELEAMKGLDTEIWRPQMIVMEVANFQDQKVMMDHVDFMKSRGYVPDSLFELTEHDFIFVDERKFS